MVDSILQSSRPVDEKVVMQHHEISNTLQYSHQEMTEPGSEEAMQESEKDIPMTFRRFMGFSAMAFLWTGSQIPVYLFGMSKTT
ncbi:hypothetical protein ACN38_g12079 [Penicillium nordicum]|uniref:Uncharacterized protein n=1 Tax=Penicillium nordicum TaxID=229535 RepID=A0A0M9WA67_9EURO|nr:hypothetical protein ACN38_g12079 [Penicillium nordicum]